MTYLAIVVSAFITILTTAVFFYTEGYEKGYRDAYRSKK